MAYLSKSKDCLNRLMQHLLIQFVYCDAKVNVLLFGERVWLQPIENSSLYVSDAVEPCK